MTLAQALVSIFSVLALVGCLADALRIYRNRRHSASATSSLVDLDRAMQAQREEIEIARQEADRQRKRADEYFATIDGCVQEAAEAKRNYQSALASFGAAQSMLFREIESLSMQYQGLVTEFRTATGGKSPRHVNPIRNRALTQIAAELGVLTPAEAPPEPSAPRPAA